MVSGVLPRVAPAPAAVRALLERLRRRGRRWTDAAGGRTLEAWCGHRSRWSRRRGVSGSGRIPRVVVSLTTTPARVGTVHLAVESLLRQDVKPDVLVLWLSERFDGALPPALVKQQARGLTVRRCVDVGPHTKYRYALDTYPESALVLADDDMVYRRSWLRGLVDACRDNPEVVSCYRARRMLVTNAGRLRPYLMWPNVTARSGPDHALFPLSGNGVIYPPGVLPAQALDTPAFQELTPGNDDVWLKAMSLLAGRSCQVVHRAGTERWPIAGAEASALFETNRIRNDHFIHAVWERYRLRATTPGTH